MCFYGDLVPASNKWPNKEDDLLLKVREVNCVCNQGGFDFKMCIYNVSASLGHLYTWEMLVLRSCFRLFIYWPMYLWLQTFAPSQLFISEYKRLFFHFNDSHDLLLCTVLSTACTNTHTLAQHFQESAATIWLCYVTATLHELRAHSVFEENVVSFGWILINAFFHDGRQSFWHITQNKWLNKHITRCQ